MKIENPQKYLQKNSLFQNGDSMKLKFKLPKLESVNYGIFEELEGEIPLILKHGEHPKCPFYDLTESTQQEIIESFYNYILSLDENLGDDELYSASVFNIIVTLAYLPTLEPGTDLFGMMVKLIGALVIGDDGIDTQEFMEGINSGNALLKIRNSIKETQEGNLGSFNKIPLVFPPLAPAWTLLDSFFKSQADGGSGYYYFFGECFDIVTSQLVIFSKKSNTYNDEAWSRICGINKALGMPLEFSAGLQGLEIDGSLRGWWPFREMKNCFYSINSGLNDIRGIIRDVKYDKVTDSSILSRIGTGNGKETDLSQAFHSVLGSVQGNYRNIITLMDFIESTFPNEPNVKDYIFIMKTMLDGQVYGYFGFPFELRYGTAEASIIKA